MLAAQHQEMHQELLETYWEHRRTLVLLIDEYNSRVKEAESLIDIQRASDAIAFEIQRLEVLRYRLIGFGVTETELLSQIEVVSSK
jgi:Cdc6-like AAA superfamily ATPase